MKVITAPEEITTNWLIEVLQQNGYLRSETIVDVNVEYQESTHALTAQLHLTFASNANPTIPTELFLKVCKEGSAIFGDSEVRYYEVIGKPMPDAPMPRCFDATYTPENHRYHLLLENVNSTHHNNCRTPLSLQNAKKTVDALAKLHTFWWNHPELATKVGRYPTEAVIERYLNHVNQGLEPMLEAVGERFSEQDKTTIRKIFTEHRSLLLARATTQKHFTFIHGDLNPGNILSSNNENSPTYLIDHQPFDWSLITWLGVSDLAYMMVHWWDSEARRELEKPLLEHYYQQLQTKNIHYTWDELWYDYRLTAIQSFYVASEWCILEKDRKDFEWVWFPQLQKTFTAFQDLGAMELFTDQVK